MRVNGQGDWYEARADAMQELADQQGKNLAKLRERLGRAEGESAALREQITAEREHTTIERARAETSARGLEATRAELAEWTAGGPLARALRALVYRRGRQQA